MDGWLFLPKSGRQDGLVLNRIRCDRLLDLFPEEFPGFEPVPCSQNSGLRNYNPYRTGRSQDKVPQRISTRGMPIRRKSLKVYSPAFMTSRLVL